ncbi:hypothetical protein DXG01_009499 [Tephrocybe rancida]|nr:hypothetical protein DXG01_009499 [Tephrocybe rancida]
MASKPTAATRASSRTKPTPAPAPTMTRTTRARTATTKVALPTATVATTTAKKAAVRKPLATRENSVETSSAAKVAPKPTRKTTAKQANVIVADSEREPINVSIAISSILPILTISKAYLRIRPHLGDDEAVAPYLTPLTDTTVRMADPNEQQNRVARYRPSALPASSIYTFSHVFPPDTTQSGFFAKTTLPLVRDVLQGQNGLLFTYGVTNSGKTYTVQGGSNPGSAGILPRTLDVIFNSIEGLHGDGRFRPVRLQGVEPADPNDSKPPQVVPEPALAEVLGQHLDISASDTDVDPTVLKVDRNYEYTIWLSYAEVYNEKVYDLLESVKDDTNNVPSGIPRATTAKNIVLTRAALSLKPSPASDNGDSATNGKYISGLRQFRVHSASQAKALVKLGQLHRRVFGTLANSESSRSHGLVILKVVKGHRGERDDPTALQISRLTLVDLAGSERTKHTHTTGDRLREAGNINKSLMVLGQCMEVMRSNQRKLAMSLAQEGSGKDARMDTRDVKKTLAVVPFRHSKLTEALMDYFIGDGKAVMIVNVNPYDTGYDENSHVMRFAALAREVYVTPAPAPVHQMKGPGKTKGTTIKELGPLTLKDPEIVPHKPYRRKVTISMGGQGTGRKPSEAILEVLEEDEPKEDDQDEESDDEPINPLVDALFDEVENLRLQLFESEMRCAIIEAETRDEVMHEMEERMRNMEEMYSRRLMKELEQNELKTDAKIDMLHQSGLFGSPIKQRQVARPPSEFSEGEEGDVEMSLIDYGEDEESGEEFGLSDHENSTRSRSQSMSPLAKKGKGKPHGALVPEPKVIREVRKFVPDQPLPPDNDDAELTETEAADTESVAASGTIGSDMDEDEDEDREDDEDYSDEEVEDEWVPPAPISAHNKTPKAKPTVQRIRSPPPEAISNGSTVPRLKDSHNRVAKLAHVMDGLSLDGPDDSVVILPTNKYRARQPSSNFEEDEDEVENDDEEFELPVPKKKKRQLGKTQVMTEEDIEKTTSAVERKAAKAVGTKSVRRLTGYGR